MYVVNIMTSDQIYAPFVIDWKASPYSVFNLYTVYALSSNLYTGKEYLSNTCHGSLTLDGEGVCQPCEHFGKVTSEALGACRSKVCEDDGLVTLADGSCRDKTCEEKG